MIEFLAQVAKNARKQGHAKAGRVAVAAEIDQSTLYRFERGFWPQNADQVIAGYAEELGIDPITLWRRAMELWLASAPEEPASAERLAMLEAVTPDEVDEPAGGVKPPPPPPTAQDQEWLEAAEHGPGPADGDDQPGEAPGRSAR